MKAEFACAVIAVFALVFGLTAGIIPVKMPASWDELAEYNSVLIGANGKDFCSGVVIGHGVDGSGEFSIISSAAHCFKYNKFGIEVTRGKDRNTGILLSIDPVGDVAILKSSLKANGQCIKVAAEAVEYKRGASVVLLANPYIAYFQTTAFGAIVAPVMTVPFSSGDETEVFMTTAQSTGGSSGGGLLDIYGRMIGVNSGSINGTVFSFSAPVSKLKFLIQKLNIGEHICYG